MLTRRPLWSAVLIPVLSLVAFGAAAQEPAVDLGDTQLLLFDFETDEQVEQFAAEDSARAADPDAATSLVHKFRSALGAPGVGGDRSLHVRFYACEDGWANVRTSVDGAAWKAESVGRISFWLNCYAPDRTVDLVLFGAEDAEYRATIELPYDEWLEVTVPLDALVAADGAKASDHVEELTALALGRKGAWSECTFRIDHIRVAPSESPTPVEPDAPVDPGPTPPDDPEPGEPGVTEPVVEPDAPEGPVRADAYSARAEVSYGSATEFYFRPYLGANALPGDEAHLANPTTAALVRGLEPMIRVKVAAPAAPSDDADVIAALQARVRAVAAVAKERGVMVGVSAPIDAISPDRFAGFCEQLVRAVNAGPENTRVRYWELLDSPVLLSDADYRAACQLVNSAAKRMLAVDPDVRVGGMSFYAAQRGPMDRVLRGTKGAMKFVSWHFYGAGMLSAPDNQLFQAADSGVAYGIPDVIGPTQVVDLLKVGDLYESGLLFVTECNLNNVKTADGRCQDPRGSSPMAGAWLASYLATVGPLVDVVLVSEMFGDTWGMVTPDGRAGPVYWTARLFKDHFPRGAQIAPSRSPTGAELRTLGAVIDNRRLLLLINRSDKPADVEVVCRGLPRGATASVYSVGDGEGIVETPVTLEYATRRAAPPPTAEAGAPAAAPGLDAVAPHVPLPPYGVAILEIRTGTRTTP